MDELIANDVDEGMEVAYVGDAPWSTLGVEVPEEISLDELLRLSNLDWRIQRQQLLTFCSPTAMFPVKDYFALVRDIDHHVLGICGKEYVPFQNSEVLRFFEQYCAAGNLKLSFVGSLDAGRLVWALAKVNSTVVGKNDLIDGYLLFCQPHVWGKALFINYLPVRVTCMNTLNMPISARSERWHVPHLRAFDNVELINSVDSAIALANERLTEYRDKVMMLVRTRVTRLEVMEYLVKLFQPRLLQAMTPTQILRSPLKLSKATIGAYNSTYNAPGSNLGTARGTMWGAFNGVLYYLDHLKGRDRALALQSSWFGLDARLKNRALRLAVSYAKVTLH